jgi:hypothetical protein
MFLFRRLGHPGARAADRGISLSKLRVVPSLVVFASLCLGTACADLLDLNPSFEIGSNSLPVNCGTGCSYSDSSTGASPDSITIPDWTISSFTLGAGVYVPNSTSNSPALTPVPDGQAVAFTSGGSIYQTVTATAVVGDSYTLTAWIADAGGGNYNQFVQSASVSICNATCGFGSLLPSNASYLYATATGNTLDGGVWTQVATTFVMPATGPGGASLAGDSITITLFNQGGAGQAQFDDATLTDNSVAGIVSTPEPTSILLLLTVIAAAALITRRRLTSANPASPRPI